MEDVAIESKAYKYFSYELSLINNSEIKSNVVTFIDSRCPDYFWTIPASTSGRYHPEYCLGVGGLLKHTKAVVIIANELFEIYNFHQSQKDIIIASLILHDMFKCGSQSDYEDTHHTIANHPLYCANEWNEMVFKSTNFNENWWRTAISKCIACHMGKFNEGSRYSGFERNMLMPIPETEVEKFVHLCDYLASRKVIEVKL